MSTITQYANQYVLDLVAYQPGKPIEETARELGLKVTDIVKLASNENSLGPSPKAIEAMENGNIVIFGGGLGSPYFSTDTAAALRAAEIESDALLMAKNIDGVYSADPKIDPSAVRYDEITYKEVISKELKALDLSAATFCMENDITVYAFGLKDPMNIYRAVMGEKIGTELHK